MQPCLLEFEVVNGNLLCHCVAHVVVMLAKLGNDLLSPVQHVGHVFLIVVINRPEMLGFGRGKRKMVRH